MQQHPANPNWQTQPYGPPPQQWAPPTQTNWGPPPPRPAGPRKVSAVGSTGLALSVIGVFVLPIVFGLAGLICGVVDVSTARTGQRSPGTGWAAIIVGALALLIWVVMLGAALSGG